MRAHQPGICYLTVFATQHWVSTCLDVSWRHTSFCEILTRSSQRIRDLLIMCYINLHFTYLLTYTVWKFCHFALFIIHYVLIQYIYVCMLLSRCVLGGLGPLPKDVPVRTLLSPVREVSTPPPSPCYDTYDDTESLTGNFILWTHGPCYFSFVA